MFIDELRELNTKILPYGFIAGGVCRSILQGEEIKDIDIFCRTEASFEALLELFNLNNDSFFSGLSIVRENELMLEFEYEIYHKTYIIQIIKPRKQEYICTYGTPFEVVSKFDFTICRLYLNEIGEIQSVDVFSEILPHLDKKLLIIENIVCPISSMRRVMKYVKRGYFLPLKQMMKLFVEFQNRGLDIEELLEKIKQQEEEFDWYEFFSKNNID